MRFYTIVILSYLFTACGDLSSDQKDEYGAKINPETRLDDPDALEDENVAECSSETQEPIIEIRDREVIVEVPLADNQFYDSIGDNLWVKGGSTTIAQAQLACSDGFRLPTPSELQLGLSRGLTHSSTHLWTNENQGYSAINNHYWYRAVTTADAGLSSGHETNVFGVVCIEEK